MLSKPPSSSNKIMSHNPIFNQKSNLPIDQIYAQGFLPQRNEKGLFYLSSSSRSNLSKFNLSSENRRILNKTNQLTFITCDLTGFNLDLETKKRINSWIKNLGWDFPMSSVKYVFKNHIFNTLYIWYDGTDIIAYSICLFGQDFSHISYVFYHPDYQHQNLPIRLVLQVIIDSSDKKLDYCYLGQFSPTTGFYKRTMPGFEYYQENQWIIYSNDKQ